MQPAFCDVHRKRTGTDHVLQWVDESRCRGTSLGRDVRVRSSRGNRGEGGGPRCGRREHGGCALGDRGRLDRSPVAGLGKGRRRHRSARRRRRGCISAECHGGWQSPRRLLRRGRLARRLRARPRLLRYGFPRSLRRRVHARHELRALRLDLDVRRGPMSTDGHTAMIIDHLRRDRLSPARRRWAFTARSSPHR